MAFQIRISPDALRSAAEQHRSIKDAIQDSVSLLDEITGRLEEAWEGAAASNARTSLSEARTVVKQIAEGINDSASKLEGIASAFEMLDSGETATIMTKLGTGFIPMPIQPAFLLSQAGRVRIIPDQVRDAAVHCKKLATVYSDNASAFASTITNLGNEWEGKSYSKYVDESQEVIKTLQQVSEVLAEFGEKLIAAANRYEEIDNML